MADYRIYSVAQGDSFAGPPIVIACETDAEAIEKARERQTNRDLEVWQGARCIIRLKAPDAS